jgi:hypothetical protein
MRASGKKQVAKKNIVVELFQHVSSQQNQILTSVAKHDRMLGEILAVVTSGDLVFFSSEYRSRNAEN